MAETLVISHAGCHDGFGAAWVAWKALGEVCFQFAKYGDTPPNVTGKHVYIFDFSYPRPMMEQMMKDAAFFRCCDHHKSAQANCEGLERCEFDMERSGAGMAWDYFHPGEPRPPLIDYAEDRDLWRFDLPESREVFAWIASFPKDFSRWDHLAWVLDETPTEAWSEGAAILRAENQKVEEMCAEAQMVDLGDGLVPAVNCPYNFGSMVGERLNQMYPDAKYSCYYFTRKDGKEQWGYRSTGYDVSEVAKRFGGGGHQRAAGSVKGMVTRG